MVARASAPVTNMATTVTVSASIPSGVQGVYPHLWPACGAAQRRYADTYTCQHHGRYTMRLAPSGP
jgi:hypothetical protein